MSEIGQKIIAAVRDVAAKNPSFIYLNAALMGADGNFCVYVKDGDPSCLIGQALWKLGLIDAALEADDFNAVGADDLLRSLPIGDSLDPNEIEWLTRVQEMQDAEKPWSEAVEWADNFKEEMLQDW